MKSAASFVGLAVTFYDFGTTYTVVSEAGRLARGGMHYNVRKTQPMVRFGEVVGTYVTTYTANATELRLMAKRAARLNG